MPCTGAGSCDEATSTFQTSSVSGKTGYSTSLTVTWWNGVVTVESGSRTPFWVEKCRDSTRASKETSERNEKRVREVG